jgi:nickel-dependent lactate racemase
MMYAEFSSVNENIPPELLEGIVKDILGNIKNRGRVMAVVPDITRMQSRAGDILKIVYENLKEKLSAVMPALGTHLPMTEDEIARMYPGVPSQKFKGHDWRHGIIELGRIPSSYVREVGQGVVDYDYPVQVNRSLVEEGADIILSIGQVVPHEVVGMGNHAKNIFVGTGGKEAIDKSHFLGACFGMEKIIGRINTPVRQVFNEALEVAKDKLPRIIWILTVVDRNNSGENVIKGLFAGDDLECFYKAALFSQKVNITYLDEEVHKAIIWLDPHKYRSTWVANKSIHHVRMAMADKGEMIVLAPGLAQFGEDRVIDSLIRKYGYRPYTEIKRLVGENEDLGTNLAAAAHLIHGSSEGRFEVTYAPGPGISRDEIERVGFNYLPLQDLLDTYDIRQMKEGWNILSTSEKVFFVSDPSTGLWTSRERFHR